ncbi:MAG: helix-turn-helix domain-containing protein [Firmicutes bacterium]|nr:helix-turn-helix domain-containing protein [Bacillota bacterium]
MDSYVTGTAIKRLREAKGLTQAELADKIDVSAKAVSKWETAKGLPDISLLEPLAAALGVSVLELMSGAVVANGNRCANMLRSKMYVCPVCGNIIHTMGEAVISCCGIALTALEAEEADPAHTPQIQPVEDEHFITVGHPMTKTHYISFIAYVSTDRLQIVKLYPEGNAECRIRLQRHGYLYLYCNRHGLIKHKI